MAANITGRLASSVGDDESYDGETGATSLGTRISGHVDQSVASITWTVSRDRCVR